MVVPDIALSITYHSILVSLMKFRNLTFLYVSLHSPITALTIGIFSKHLKSILDIVIILVQLSKNKLENSRRKGYSCIYLYFCLLLSFLLPDIPKFLPVIIPFPFRKRALVIG